MKEIVKVQYQADDGTLFSSREQCANYELSSSKIDAIVSKLGTKPNLNDEQYVQHSMSDVNYVRRELCLLANSVWEHKWFIQTAEDPFTHSYWAGRLISEMDNPKLNAAWYRIMCIDSNGREWQQPYFANNTPSNPVEVQKS